MMYNFNYTKVCLSVGTSDKYQVNDKGMNHLQDTTNANEQNYGDKWMICTKFSLWTPKERLVLLRLHNYFYVN